MRVGKLMKKIKIEEKTSRVHQIEFFLISLLLKRNKIEIGLFAIFTLQLPTFKMNLLFFIYSTFLMEEHK